MATSSEKPLAMVQSSKTVARTRTPIWVRVFGAFTRPDGGAALPPESNFTAPSGHQGVDKKN